MREGRDEIMIKTLNASEVFHNWIANSRSENTKDSYKRIVPTFFQMVLNTTLDDLTEEAILSLVPSSVEMYYKSILLNKGMKQSTIINYLKVVGAYFHQLEVNNIFPGVNYLFLREEVLSYKRLKDDTVSRKKMGVSEYDAFYEWLITKNFSKRYADKGIKYAAALKFMYTTAVRIDATFQNIKWSNFVREEDFYGQIGWTIYALDKGEKVNKKPITDEYYNELREACYNGHEDELVFGDLSKQSFTRLMREFSDETGKEFTPHSIKVGAGTRLYNLTKDIVMVQRFLDHDDPKTTVRYIRTDDDRTKSGSYVMANKIDLNELDKLSHEELLDIIKSRQDLAYGVLLESSSRG